MLDLANMINDGNIEIVGKRPGEKTNEDLISEREISRTYIYGDDIHIESKENTGDNKLNEPYNSKSAEKMSTLEMRDLIWG
jgi:FlaA1/EpsC-like NDP-sugar epimerase